METIPLKNGTKKGRQRQPFQKSSKSSLLDFGFFEFHVLFSNWIIFTLDQFIGHCAAVLFGNIEEPCVSSAFQFNLDGRSFCHFGNPT